MASKQRIKNTGKPSESIFVTECEKRGAAVFRMRDAADLYGLNNRKVGAFEMPSDYIVVSPRGMFFAEVKSSNNKTSFSLNMLARGQKAAAAKCTIVFAGKFYRIYIHNVTTDKWYVMDGADYVHKVRDGIKSIKWTDMTPLHSWVF